MPIKQYVNLDPNSPDQLDGLDKKRAGKYVTFTAKLNKAIEGVPIMFEMTAGAKNVSASLDAGNFTLKQLRRISKSTKGGMDVPGTLKRRIATDAKGESKIKLILSVCGGDEFTVKAYIPSRKGEGKELASETYVIWRRLYYQVSRFKGGPKGAGRKGTLPEIPALPWGPVKDEFLAKKHNIELVEDTSSDLISRHWNTLWDMSLLKSSAFEGYDNSKEPVTIRTVLVNELSDAKVIDLVFPIVKENTDAVKQIEEMLFFDESKKVKEDFLLDATWKYVDGSDTTEKPLDFQYVEAEDYETLKINFSKIPKRHLLDVWRKVSIKLKLRVIAGSSNGLSYGNTIWLAGGSMYAGNRTGSEKQRTAIHEIGHYIGMVAAVEGQKNWYEGKGHQGPHCSQGLSEEQTNRDFYYGLPGTCVMFGESAETRLGHFCVNCSPSVRMNPVPPKRMETNWKPQNRK